MFLWKSKPQAAMVPQDQNRWPVGAWATVVRAGALAARGRAVEGGRGAGEMRVLVMQVGKASHVVGVHMGIVRSPTSSPLSGAFNLPMLRLGSGVRFQIRISVSQKLCSVLTKKLIKISSSSFRVTYLPLGKPQLFSSWWRTTQSSQVGASHI